MRVQILAFLTLCLQPAFAAEASDIGKTIATRGGATITLGELDVRMSDMPSDAREGMLVDPDRMETILSDMLLIKQLAAEARAKGVDKDPRFLNLLNYSTDRLLASWRNGQLLSESPKADWKALAEESYAADPDRFKAQDLYTVRHLLIKTGTGCRDKSAARALVDGLRARAVKGEDFEALAKANSEDEATRENGGMLGSIDNRNLDPVFEAAARKLVRPGEISDVVETRFGFHVIQLVQRKAAPARSADEVRDELATRFRKERGAKYRKEHQEQLRSMAVESDAEVLATLPKRYLPGGPGLISTLNNYNAGMDETEAGEGAKPRK